MLKFQRLVGLLWPLSLLPVLGCSSYSQPRFVSIQPPVMGCDADPDIPKTDDPAAFALYCVDVWQAGQSCRDTVNDYRAWAASLPQ